MLASELKQRVSVQARTVTNAGTDSESQSWSTTRARLAAKVQPLQGRDLERARQVDPRISHKVTIRAYRNAPTELAGGRARLVYHPTAADDDDRVFEVIGPPIDVEERHERLELTCRELQ